MNKNHTDIYIFLEKLIKGEPFSFSRFSDGETEILKNRSMFIKDNEVHYNNNTIKYHYPLYDTKSFIPERDKLLRSDLYKSLVFSDAAYFKGIPGSHNSVDAKKYYIDLLENKLDCVTFADIFINNNYSIFLKKLMSVIKQKENVYALCNELAQPKAFFADWISIPTDAFPNYQSVFSDCMSQLSQIPNQSIVLSSASSLSNIFAHHLRLSRPDCTFLDLGSALNSHLGLESVTRVYHVGVHGPRNLRDVKMYIKHLLYSQGSMRW